MVNRSGPDFVKERILPDLVSEERPNGIIKSIHRRVNTDFEDFYENSSIPEPLLHY